MTEKTLVLELPLPDHREYRLAEQSPSQPPFKIQFNDNQHPAH